MSQGRTATVEKFVDGEITWFKKRNPTPELTDIEFRIYDALRGALFLECEMPTVRRDEKDSSILYIEDVGSSLADDLVLNPQALEAPLVLPSYLMRVVKVRAAVNETINAVLTPDDKTYLTEGQKTSLLHAAQKRAPLSEIVTEQDLQRHFWAYRAMHALGIHDEKFKETYTRVLGDRIEAHMPRYGMWVADNALRNNALRLDDNGFLTVIPFDFNCIRYELRQMDEAAVTGIHFFPAFGSSNNVMLEWSRKRYGNETGDHEAADYLAAYAVSAFHKQLMLAGYRTQEMVALHGALDDQLQHSASFDFKDYIEFRKAYDEIELHQAALLGSIQAIPSLVPSISKQDIEDLAHLYDVARENTRFKRTRLIATPVMDYGERLLYSR
ncbi:MAG: hypothetical protein AABX82_06415 [Nanoarchaeota archaeon]